MTMPHQPPNLWQRLEAVYETATPERSEHIDQLLDEMEHAAREWWLLPRGVDRFKALDEGVDLYVAGQ